MQICKFDEKLINLTLKATGSETLEKTWGRLELAKDKKSHLRLSVDKIGNNKCKEVGGHPKCFLVLIPHISARTN